MPSVQCVVYHRSAAVRTAVQQYVYMGQAHRWQGTQYDASRVGQSCMAAMLVIMCVCADRGTWFACQQTQSIAMLIEAGWLDQRRFGVFAMLPVC